MIRFLQINLGCKGSAQDVMQKTALDLKADILIVSELNRSKSEEEGWYCDRDNKAAIVVLSDLAIDRIGQSEKCYRWIEIKGIRIYSCYWPPSLSWTEYTEVVRSIEDSIREASVPVIVAGDFNAKSPDWCSPVEDYRGELLSETMASLRISACNHGDTATFVRDASRTFIDITFTSDDMMNKVLDWKVLKIDTLSLHRYITFSIQLNNGNGRQASHRVGWSTKKLDRTKFINSLKESSSTWTPNLSPIAHVELVSKWLRDACDCAMPKLSQHNKRKPVSWWSKELDELRNNACACRRAYQRIRKRQDGTDFAVEARAMRESRKAFVIAIKEAKKREWNDLIEMLDRDPWGIPYKAVMKKLSRRRAIPGIGQPGRLKDIVEALFPQHPLRDENLPTEDVRDDPGFSMDELMQAVNTLSNGKSPGPDGIKNEILKIAVKELGRVFLTMYNKCWLNGLFPKDWKIADLVLLVKPGKPLEQPSAYRPLCMLSTVGKLFEKLISGRIRTHLEGTGGLTENQHGFRRGHSTLNAMERIKQITYTTGDKGITGMVTIDVKNAFNSAPWSKILEAVGSKSFSPALSGVLKSYLHDREIRVWADNSIEFNLNVSSGVPQGSVLGPELWNILYDDVLRMTLPPEVELLAYADDLAIIASGIDNIDVQIKLSFAANEVRAWMSSHGLEVAVEKTEMIALTKKRKRNELEIVMGESTLITRASLRYLGVQLDGKMNFDQHSIDITAKAAATAQKLKIIMPNVRGPKEAKRRLLASVVSSQLLYGAPFWIDTISQRAINRMASVYRKAMLRVGSCYRTVSYDACSVVTNMPPFKVLAQERATIYHGTSRAKARVILLDRWQEEWEQAKYGRWTHKLIPNINIWVNRKFGQVNYHLTQFLTGHGGFGTYLHKFCGRETNTCLICGAANDDAEYAVLLCEAWANRRRDVCMDILVDDISADNIIGLMLRSKRDWEKITEMVEYVMRTRETEERRLQQVERTHQTN